MIATLSAQTLEIAIPDLIEQALVQGGERSDNVTALAFEWEGGADSAGQSPSGFTHTQAMSDGGFSSTVQAGDLDLLLDDAMDDITIERSIAEINEAIKSTTMRQR
jgi:hypothetical protein